MGDCDVLYHYTSIDTLNAILNGIKTTVSPEPLENISFKLRATQWAFFNDPLENRYFLNKIVSFIEKDKDLSKYKDSFSDVIFYASGFSGVPYIISLSKSRDNLDMWRNYSKDGAGVAIGFKSKELADSIEDLRKKSVMDSLKMYDCRYLNDDIITEIINGLKPELLRTLSGTSVRLESFGPLINAFCLFKHPCYINECEKRIVLFDHYPRAKESKYRVSKGVNIPYREITLPLSTIKDIVIGPCANKELNTTSIRMQLGAISPLTDNISIEFSELPYRQV